MSQNLYKKSAALRAAVFDLFNTLDRDGDGGTFYPPQSMARQHIWLHISLRASWWPSTNMSCALVQLRVCSSFWVTMEMKEGKFLLNETQHWLGSCPTYGNRNSNRAKNAFRLKMYSKKGFGRSELFFASLIPIWFLSFGIILDLTEPVTDRSRGQAFPSYLVLINFIK